MTSHGVDAGTRLKRTTDVIMSGIREGLHRGGQLYVSLRFEVVANTGFGAARSNVPMMHDTLNVWRSAGKPIAAAAVLRLQDFGRLTIEDPVSRHLPQFPHEDVRILDLLTHTSGLPNRPLDWPAASWDEIVDAVCAFPRDPNLGAAYSYHATWFLLGEILRRHDAAGRTWSEILRSDILEPCQLHDVWNGMSQEVWQQLAPRMARQETILLAGRRREEPLHTPEYCMAASPGANLRSTARDAGRFYELLMRGGESENGFRLLQPETVRLMTTPHRIGQTDATFRHVVDMGLGVITDSNRYGADTVPYGYGRWCSAATFGHGGAQCAMAFCDPERQLVVAWVVNGFPGEARHQARNRAINEAIYADLGLA